MVFKRVRSVKAWAFSVGGFPPLAYLPPCGWQDIASVGAKGRGCFVFGMLLSRASRSIASIMLLQSLLRAKRFALALAHENKSHLTNPLTNKLYTI
ncbi:hypothetical protein Q765_19890 [Flavobacterium rivuli WB 3.3-2 = DSM 21788]|uniref:Uncharacterized protein n=1 Tax=Flavobacterium rivuli WB 3.3-2 = DSM 21788 TaxID=1121895 RepID=A0A0A2LWN7_9FLAO|nr:hypothetical protein Q765_19890 [Flavobacterium rivuli WB 3.3-2 = DSM 21788]